MTKLIWGLLPEMTFESGVNRGVLYPKNSPGVVWDGLLSIQETPSEGTVTSSQIDGVTYLNKFIPDGIALAVAAFTYPDEFDESTAFGLSYRTNINDGSDYKIHLVYNLTAVPSQISYSTLNADPDTDPFAWNMSSVPLAIANASPSAHLIVDTRYVNAGLITALENILYGGVGIDPRLPAYDEVKSIFDSYATLIVTDNGDGTATISGPDDVVYSLSSTEWEIDWVSVIPVNTDTVQLSTF